MEVYVDGHFVPAEEARISVTAQLRQGFEALCRQDGVCVALHAASAANRLRGHPPRCPCVVLCVSGIPPCAYCAMETITAV